MDGYTNITVDPSLPAVAVYSASALSVLDCSTGSMQRVDLQLPAHVHYISSCSFSSREGDDVAEGDQRRRSVTERAVQRLYFYSGVSLFNKLLEQFDFLCSTNIAKHSHINSRSAGHANCSCQWTLFCPAGAVAYVHVHTYLHTYVHALVSAYKFRSNIYVSDASIISYKQSQCKDLKEIV